MFGNFCSFSCVLAYNDTLNDYRKNIREGLIKKLLRENLNQLKFSKIEVELFNYYDSVTHDYENGSRGGSSYSTPKDKRIKLRKSFK